MHGAMSMVTNKHQGGSCEKHALRALLLVIQ
jgi:hypothetical protein